MEINLSCPNITGKEPPAYSRNSLMEYLGALQKAVEEEKRCKIEIGFKLPPYTHSSQYDALIEALLSVSPCPIAFITSTNTLGSSLALSENLSPTINSETGTGIGGLAGDALHPLSLGNVRTIRAMLDQHQSLKDISIIGVGGISDGAGYKRMRAVGADSVAVATALGLQGIGVFPNILEQAETVADKEVVFTNEFSSSRPKL